MRHYPDILSVYLANFDKLQAHYLGPMVASAAFKYIELKRRDWCEVINVENVPYVLILCACPSSFLFL